MSINGIGYATSPLGQAITSLNNQMTNLSTQLATGEKSTNYAGMGVNEGFAIAARSQLASISAFTDTISNVGTTIQSANNALQAISSLSGQVQSSAASTPQTLDSNGKTIAQENASAELSSMIGILNTPSGNRYMFSGTAINTPATVPVDEMLNGTTTQAGLNTVMAQRAQADGAVPGGTGRLLITNPAATLPATPTVVSVAEDAAGSPFGLKLDTVSLSKSMTDAGATVTGPAGSPAAISINLGSTNSSVGDQVSFTFLQPDGTTASVQLTATTTSPAPTGSFLIGSSPAATAANLTTALTGAIGTVANTSLVAASAVAAGDNFFNTASVATGNSVVDNQAVPPAAITGATALSGTGPDSLSPGFTAGDTLTINGTTLQFVTGTAGSGQISTSATVGDLLSTIDSITGTSTPSTIDGGKVEIHTDDAASLSISSSPAGAIGNLGFSGASITAPVPPLRVSGTPLSSATSLVAGTSANTVQWYTGNSGPGSARASSTARIDSAITVQYGAQANESAIRSQLQSIAVFAAFTASGTNSAAQISALSQSIATNLTPQAGQQTISDIQSDFARAQTVMQDTSARQAQSQTMLQDMVDSTETVSTQTVASEILALQTSLQASYQTTSMMSQLSLTKYLPTG
jgi:flagellar hook-associated protein 3 FlgL